MNKKKEPTNVAIDKGPTQRSRQRAPQNLNTILIAASVGLLIGLLLKR